MSNAVQDPGGEGTFERQLKTFINSFMIIFHCNVLVWMILEWVWVCKMEILGETTTALNQFIIFTINCAISLKISINYCCPDFNY